MEALSTSYKRDKAEIVETDGHISMEKDPNERMPLISHVTTKMEKNEGRMLVCTNVSLPRLCTYYSRRFIYLKNDVSHYIYQGASLSYYITS